MRVKIDCLRITCAKVVKDAFGVPMLEMLPTLEENVNRSNARMNPATLYKMRHPEYEEVNVVLISSERFKKTYEIPLDVIIEHGTEVAGNKEVSDNEGC